MSEARLSSGSHPAGGDGGRQHVLEGSELSRGRKLLSAVVELPVRPGHQAVTASVCCAQILRYLT